MTLNERHMAAWTSRRSDERAAGMRSDDNVTHTWLGEIGEGHCPMCRGIGPHHDEETMVVARRLAGLPEIPEYLRGRA